MVGAVVRPSASIEAEPEQWDVWFNYHVAAGGLSALPDVAKDLERLVVGGIVLAEHIIPTALEILQRDEDFAAVWQSAAANDARRLEALLAAGAGFRALSQDLARFILANCLLPSVPMERLLTAMRRDVLLDVGRGGTYDAGLDKDKVLFALAQQCILNEYIYWETPEETTWVEIVKESVAMLCEAGEPVPPSLVAILACYRAPSTISLTPGALTKLEASIAGPAADFVVRAFREPRQEALIAAGIKTLTPIHDDISKQVQSQYEENPYPRWNWTRRGVPRNATDILSAYPGIDLAAFGEVAAPKILVAGCGTGQVIFSYAALFRGACITAIDLSKASLSVAKRHTDQFGLDVAYGQADLLEFPALGEQYDIIDCGGVLHHMTDPVAGARALRACLRPGGVARIGLYSAAGRDALAPAKSTALQRGYTASASDMRRFRRDVLQIAAEEGTLKLGIPGVLKALDFYSLSMFRDLIFHVIERGYTIPEITQFAAAVEMRVVGLDLSGFDKAEGARVDDLARLERAGELFEWLYIFLLQKPL